MSTGKIIGIIVVLAVLGGAYWYWSTNAGPWGAAGTYQGAAMSTSSPSDASDTAIDQDAAAIDAQLKAAAGDSTTVSSSLNDKPVTQ